MEKQILPADKSTPKLCLYQDIVKDKRHMHAPEPYKNTQSHGTGGSHVTQAPTGVCNIVLIIGVYNIAIGVHDMVVGVYNIVLCVYNIVIGVHDMVIGVYNIVIGVFTGLEHPH